jgi:hypothetical protein
MRLVVEGAVLQCSMGSSSSALSVSRADVEADEEASGNINDYAPSKNIAPFGACRSLSNPEVASATSGAAGVLTPQPCVPVVSQAWQPGSRSVEVGGVAALHDACSCACAYGGTISVTSAGQDDVEVD